MEISLSKELAPLAIYCAPLGLKNNDKEQLRERLKDGIFPLSIGLWRAFDNFSVHLPGKPLQPTIHSSLAKIFHLS